MGVVHLPSDQPKTLGTEILPADSQRSVKMTLHPDGTAGVEMQARASLFGVPVLIDVVAGSLSSGKRATITATAQLTRGKMSLEDMLSCVLFSLLAVVSNYVLCCFCSTCCGHRWHQQHTRKCVQYLFFAVLIGVQQALPGVLFSCRLPCIDVCIRTHVAICERMLPPCMYMAVHTLCRNEYTGINPPPH